MSGAQKAAAVAKGHINSSPASVVAGTAGTGSKTSKPTGTATVSNPASQKVQSAGNAKQNTATVTQSANRSSDNAPTGMTGSPSTYLSGNFSSWNSSASANGNHSSNKTSGTNRKNSSFTSTSSSSSSSSNGSSSYSSGNSYYNTSVSTVHKIENTVNDAAHKFGDVINASADKIGSDEESYEVVDKYRPSISYELVKPEPTHGEWTKIDSKSNEYQENLYMNKYKDTADDKMYNGTTTYTITKEEYDEELKKEIPFEGKEINSCTAFKSEDGSEMVRINEAVFTSFNLEGCKITSSAIVVGVATNTEIDIKEMAKYDVNKDGLFDTTECLAAFKHYLAEDDDVSVRRYDNSKKDENNNSVIQFDKKTFDEIANSNDEVYVIARADGVGGEGHKHWIVLKGYSFDKKSNMLTFDYKGSSENDRKNNRCYILGENKGGYANTYTIDCIEVYTVKHNSKLGGGI